MNLYECCDINHIMIDYEKTLRLLNEIKISESGTEEKAFNFRRKRYKDFLNKRFAGKQKYGKREEFFTRFIFLFDIFLKHQNMSLVSKAAKKDDKEQE